jgi:putative endonuclease
MPQKPPHNLGKWGESLAKRYLERKGWRIVAENFRVHQHAEIDLIAQDGATLVFVEVKTRRSHTLETAYDAWTPKKKNAMRLAMDTFLMNYTTPYEALRIDWLVLRYFPETEGHPASASIDHIQDVTF